jgi:hypothetical protein
VWVILANFDRLFAVVFIERCGHVGNALALSIMSTAMKLVSIRVFCDGAVARG